MNPETSFNAVGGVMQLFQETIEEYRRQISTLQAIVAKQQALLDSKDHALQVVGTKAVHVRGGIPRGSPQGNSRGVAEQNEEEASRVQAREDEQPQTEEVGQVKEEGERQRLVGLERLTDPHESAVRAALEEEGFFPFESRSR